MVILFVLSTVNIASITEKARKDISCYQIRELCERSSDGQIEVKFFELPSVIAEVLAPLDKLQESLTFQDLWSQYGKKAQTARKNDEAQKRELSISNVVESVWKPAYETWNQLVASVMDGSLTLGDVDKFFDGYKNRKGDLLRELVCIFNFRQGQGQTAGDASQLTAIAQKRTGQIQQYQKLHQYANAADTIWVFKEAMKFKGDFKVVEDLRNQVSMLFKQGIKAKEKQGQWLTTD